MDNKAAVAVTQPHYFVVVILKLLLRWQSKINKRRFFPMSCIRDKKCSKPKIFLAYTSQNCFVLAVRIL